MAYEHDEIVRPIGNGFSIKWDTTRVDEALEAKVCAFVREQAAEFHKIVNGLDDVDHAANNAGNGRKSSTARPRSRRSRAAVT
jgi:hypothetical protein